MNYPSKFNILPVKDKKPLVEWKAFTEREQTPQEKQEIAALSANGNSLGFVTGKVSGIFVLDIDGFEGYDEIRKRGLILPKTWQSKTPRGLHYYFKWVPELDGKVTTKTEVLPKVDTRGDGGYVVFYGWQEPRFYLSNPPKWLIDLLPNREQKPKLLGNEQENNWLLSQLEAVKPGQGKDGRTPTFVRVIGRLKNHGLSSSEIQGLLYPWAVKYNYENRIIPLVEDQFKRYPPPKTDDSQALSIDSFLQDQEEVEWLCEGMIAKRSIGFVAGLPETGKTWALMDLAVELARGNGVWLGKYPVKQAKVLFIDQERFRGETQRRLKAIIRGKDNLSPNLRDNLFVKCGTTTRLDLQHSFAAFKKEVGELQPDLIIVDSFATFHTKEENNRKDIQEVLERIKEIRNEFGCSFIFIHHENKHAFDKEAGDPTIGQMAGSIAIPAAAEFAFAVRKQDGESSMFYHTKSTLSSTKPPFLVKIVDLDESKSRIRVEAY